jgi:hypothetical protein
MTYSADPKLSVVVEKGLHRFARPLSELLFDLSPTENISDMVISGIDVLFCFFNLVDRKPIPYLYACRLRKQWYILSPHDDMARLTRNLWCEAQTKAEITAGYLQLTKNASGLWEASQVIP